MSLGNPGSWNKYGYVLGDPVNYYDPNGTCTALPPTNICFDATGTCSGPSAPNPTSPLGGTPSLVGGSPKANQVLIMPEVQQVEPRVCLSGEIVINGICDVPLSPTAQQTLQLTGAMLNGVSLGTFGFAGPVGENAILPTVAIVTLDTKTGANGSLLTSISVGKGGEVGVETPVPTTSSPIPTTLIAISPFTGLIYQPCGLVGIYIGTDSFGGGFYLNLGCSN